MKGLKRWKTVTVSGKMKEWILSFQIMTLLAKNRNGPMKSWSGKTVKWDQDDETFTTTASIRWLILKWNDEALKVFIVLN